MSIGDRLRQLREGMVPKPSQEDVGTRIGRNQRWVSYRETNKVDTSVEEAEEIVRALGFHGAFIISKSARLEQLEDSDPEDVDLALRLLAVLPRLSAEQRALIGGVVGLIEEQASLRTG